MVRSMDQQLPILYFDHPLPEAYRDLVEGRAIAVGPDDAELATAHAVLAGAKRAWNADAFALGPTMKVISRIGIGYDNVDVADATAAGVIVCNAPDAPSVSTAEHTLMLMLAVVKNLPAQIDRAREGLPGRRPARRWNSTERCWGWWDMAASPAASVLRPAMGMRCSPTTRTSARPRAASSSGLAGVRRVRRHLAACPRGCRDPSHDQRRVAGDDEAWRLPRQLRPRRSGGPGRAAGRVGLRQVAGAGLDVTDPEPLPVGHPLLRHPNVVVTPHVASATVAGRRRLYAHAIDNALNVLAGRPATIVTATG